MVTRTIVRTPRRRKIWASRNTFEPLETTTPQMLDMLDPTWTDLGLNDMAGITVMRMVGTVAVCQWSSGATTPSYVTIRTGWAWLDKNVASAGTADAQIPDPLQNGSRDTRWYHQAIFGGLEQSAPVVSNTPLGDSGDAYRHIDVTNQQKSPNATSKFMMVIQTDLPSEANTIALRIDLAFLIALP